MYLYAIYISFTIICQVMVYAHFLIVLLFKNVSFKLFKILDTGLFSDMWFTNIFSFCSLSFQHLNKIFPRSKKTFNFDRSNLFIFPFMDCIFNIISENIFPSLISQRFFSVKVLHFTLRSVFFFF